MCEIEREREREAERDKSNTDYGGMAPLSSSQTKARLRVSHDEVLEAAERASVFLIFPFPCLISEQALPWLC